jgi:type II secretory pathway pseudopilin PulG
MTVRHRSAHGSPASPTARGGVAAVWVLVVFAVLGALSVGLARQFVDARRAQYAREARVQAKWLARSGVELAVAGRIAAGDRYTGEDAAPIPGGTVQVRLTPAPADGPTAVKVECRARYQPPAGTVVVQTVSHTTRVK